MEASGISPVLLPDKFLEGAQIQVNYQATDISKAVNIHAVKDTYNIDLMITQYISKDFIGEGEHQGEVTDSRELIVEYCYTGNGFWRPPNHCVCR